MESGRNFWNSVYKNEDASKLSWFQERPEPSIEWILSASPHHSAGILDAGGGASRLVDYLLDAGYSHPAVLDISTVAISLAKERLGDRAAEVEWIEADVTAFVSARLYSIWHDRAVFHFLIRAEDRNLYLEVVKRSLLPGGRLILATFSPLGPARCSGLSTMRFSADALAEELGPAFKLMREVRVEHQTPWATKQEFQYCDFVFLGKPLSQRL